MCDICLLHNLGHFVAALMRAAGPDIRQGWGVGVSDAGGGGCYQETSDNMG